MACLRNGHEVVEEGPGVSSVESVVPAEAPAELAGAEAGVGDDVAPLEHRATGIAEARAAAGARVVRVLGQLQHLRRRVLADRVVKRRVTSLTATGF